MAPKKDVHILIPETCACVTSDSKRNFTDVIKLRILRRDILLDYVGMPSFTTRVLIKRTHKERSRRAREREGDVMLDAEFRVRERWAGATLLALRGRKGPQAKECRPPLAAGRGKDTDSHSEPPQGAQPCPHLDLGPGILFQTSDFPNMNQFVLF